MEKISKEKEKEIAEKFKDDDPSLLKFVLSSPRKIRQTYNAICYNCRVKAAKNPRTKFTEYCKPCQKKVRRIWNK